MIFKIELTIDGLTQCYVAMLVNVHKKIDENFS